METARVRRLMRYLILFLLAPLLFGGCELETDSPSTEPQSSVCIGDDDVSVCVFIGDGGFVLSF